MGIPDKTNDQSEVEALLTDPRAADFWKAICSGLGSNGFLRQLIIDAPDNERSPMPRVRGIFRKKGDRDNRSTEASFRIDSSVFLDFNLRTALDNVEVVYRQAGWKTPLVTGIWGDPKIAGKQDRILYIFFEQPLQFSSYAGADKAEMERLQVDRFCTDSLLQTGDTPYEAYESGGDPPDFECTDRNRRVSLECTRLSVQNRREAHAFLGKTREFVMAAVARNRRDFAHLRGLNVFLRFGDGEDVSGYPPKPTMESQLTEIVEALTNYNRTPSRSGNSGTGEQSRENPNARLSFGGSLRASRFSDSFPETQFFTKAGFELSLGFQTVHTHNSAWDELQSQIVTKDRPENEDLLISVGAPNQEGLVFLSEDLIAESALASGRELDKLRYLKRVFIHFWSSRRIVQLWPKRQEIAPNGFAYDLVPSHSRRRLP